jgi:cytidylate kinase
MVAIQRRIAQRGGIVVEGRDVGTVVFPQADIKFFITASIKERSKRRYREMKKEGYEVSLKSVQQEMLKRDHLDSTRDHNPLRKASDAISVDTTSENASMVTRKLLKITREHLGQVRGRR